MLGNSCCATAAMLPLSAASGSAASWSDWTAVTASPPSAPSERDTATDARVPPSRPTTSAIAATTGQNQPGWELRVAAAP